MINSAESLVDAVDGGIPTMSRKLGAMLIVRLVRSCGVVNSGGGELNKVLYPIRTEDIDRLPLGLEYYSCIEGVL